MAKDNSSMESYDNSNINHGYPSGFILLIIILFLFLLSFCISVLSLKNNSVVKLNYYFHEYLQLFSSGILFSFALSNLYIINVTDISKNIVVIFICVGYILNYFLG